MGLFDYQSKMIDNYMDTLQNTGGIKDKHVAFELPTGSGKTLIGILIAEFHRRKYHRKVLFLCPTNQLVTQVCKQAQEKYGIEAIAFCGKQSEYSPSEKSDYFLGKKLGITTYSSFFAASKFFTNTEVLIFDDVHSSEQFIADNWSIIINKHDYGTLYLELAEIIKDTEIGESFYSRMTADSPYEGDIMNWCDMIPIPIIEERLADIARIINSKAESSNLCFAWSRIKDHLRECNIYVSWESILIRPYIPPTLSFEPFKNALQCIYMSATLGKSGELERITGVDKIRRLPYVSEWENKEIGRKFFVFPDLSFDSKMHNEIILSLHQITNKSIVIVPNNKEQEELTKIITDALSDIKVYKAQDLVDSKDNFKKQENAMAIIANRYDGIDFPDEESRMLILKNLPKTTHLQEQFFYSRMSASVLFSERIKTRIVQAVGRCTRNANDYAVVCVLGNSVLNDLITENHLKGYKPELRAEIRFGIENSQELSDPIEMYDNIKLFLSRDSSWASAEEDIVNLRNSYITEDEKQNNNDLFDKLRQSAIQEVKLQYALWKKDYVLAFNIINDIISFLNAPKLRGYRAFWQYYAGHIAMKLDTIHANKVNELFRKAAGDVLGISWLASLAQISNNVQVDTNTGISVDSILERIERVMYSFKSSAKIESRIATILEGIENAKGEAFEWFHTDLGKFLGYEASNPKGSGDPDPYWILNDDICIVYEDKIYESDNHKIPLDHISQANRHEKWIREKITTLHKSATIYTVFISNTKSIEEEGRIHAEHIFYLNRKDLIQWAHTALKVVRDCYNTFPGEGDAEWRAYVKDEFVRKGITPSDFIKLITKTKLCDL